MSKVVRPYSQKMLENHGKRENFVEFINKVIGGYQKQPVAHEL